MHKFSRTILVFSLVFIVLFTSCNKNPKTVLPDDFLNAYRTCDFESAMSFSDNAPGLDRILSLYRSTDEDNKALLKNIFELIQFNITNRDAGNNGFELPREDYKEIEMTISVPDYNAIISYVNNACASGISSKFEILSDMASENAYSQYMHETTITIHIIKDGENWVLPLANSENSELTDLLGINRFIPWVLG